MTQGGRAYAESRLLCPCRLRRQDRQLTISVDLPVLTDEDKQKEEQNEASID